MTKALIIGDGAIGAAVALALGDLGLFPRFVGRLGPTPFRAAFDRRTREAVDVPAPNDDEIKNAALCFVCVRAFDLETALRFTDRLGDGVPVIPLANGAVWDIVHAAALRRPTLAWRLGFATLGVSVVGKSHYALRSTAGEVSFGPLSPAAAPIAVEKRLMDGGGFFRWHPGIALLQRRKWLYNTVINSLAAARRHKCNGDLLADLSTLSSVFAEAHRFQAARWGALPQPKDELFQGLLDLITKTAENENSMARDVRLGRRTESAFLAGLARDAAQFPLLAALHRTISPFD